MRSYISSDEHSLEEWPCAHTHIHTHDNLGDDRGWTKIRWSSALCKSYIRLGHARLRLRRSIFSCRAHTRRIDRLRLSRERTSRASTSAWREFLLFYYRFIFSPFLNISRRTFDHIRRANEVSSLKENTREFRVALSIPRRR